MTGVGFRCCDQVASPAIPLPYQFGIFLERCGCREFVRIVPRPESLLGIANTLAFGALAGLLGLGVPAGIWVDLLLAGMLALSAVTIVIRVRRALKESGQC